MTASVTFSSGLTVLGLLRNPMQSSKLIILYAYCIFHAYAKFDEVDIVTAFSFNISKISSLSFLKFFICLFDSIMKNKL